jgi:hypothetical protein
VAFRRRRGPCFTHVFYKLGVNARTALPAALAAPTSESAANAGRRANQGGGQLSRRADIPLGIAAADLAESSRALLQGRTGWRELHDMREAQTAETETATSQTWIYLAIPDWVVASEAGLLRVEWSL